MSEKSSLPIPVLNIHFFSSPHHPAPRPGTSAKGSPLTALIQPLSSDCFFSY
jgi:hypothetical protein